MEYKKYKDFNEDIIDEVLDNGLRVILVKEPKCEVYAKYVVKFGANNLGKINNTDIPLGSAHFLEHRLFDYKDQDVLSLFDSYGASANAFTSHKCTVYEFNTTSNVEKCINLLLDFTQTCKFSDEKFEAEKDIIINEINDVKDQPLYEYRTKLLNNTYLNDPKKYDIGGTEESVRNTKKEQLYLIHKYFYNPSNCALVIVGDFDLERIFNLIKKNQIKKKFDITDLKYNPFISNEPKNVIKEYDECITKSLSYSCTFIKYKLCLESKDPKYLNKLSYICDLYNSLMFSRVSKLTKDMKKYINQKSINNYFSISLKDNNISLFTYNTDPKYVSNYIINAIKNYKEYIKEEYFEPYKRSYMTDFYTLSDYGEDLCYTIADNLVDENDFFNDLNVLKSITYQDILDFGKLLASSPYSVLNVFKK